MSSKFGRAKRELRTLSHLDDVLTEHGDRQAVLALQREGAASWTYSDLVEYARRLAHGLTKAGVSRGEHVMLFAPSQPEWIVACLAVVGAGAVATPVDVQLGDEALAHVLRLSGTRVIFRGIVKCCGSAADHAASFSSSLLSTSSPFTNLAPALTRGTSR
jgi:acyl-CoA synthetase (AMP-forming)/AMP-acid ligase II